MKLTKIGGSFCYSAERNMLKYAGIRSPFNVKRLVSKLNMVDGKLLAERSPYRSSVIPAKSLESPPTASELNSVFKSDMHKLAESRIEGENKNKQFEGAKKWRQPQQVVSISGEERACNCAVPLLFLPMGALTLRLRRFQWAVRKAPGWPVKSCPVPAPSVLPRL